MSHRAAVAFVVAAAFSLDSPIVRAAPPTTCGDGAAADGSRDIGCSCGDTVVTDTVLGVSDPVTHRRCPGPGLVVADGVTLDLSGETLRGRGVGVGLEMGLGASALNGTVEAFEVGVRVVEDDVNLAALDVRGNATVGIEARAGFVAVDLDVAQNGGAGISVEAAAPVRLESSVVRQNGASGVHALRAAELFLGSLVVNDNSGDGVVLGDSTAQSGTVRARLEGNELHGNRIGLRIEQKDGGAYSTATDGVHGNVIHDNRASGVQLKTSYQQPRAAGTTGLPFTANEVFHNAMGAACTSAQTDPQIEVVGPVATTAAHASACAAAAADLTGAACMALNAPAAACYWTGSTCIPVWDLRGAVSCELSSNDVNRIHSYNTSSDAVGSSERSVGLYASGGANVWADDNSWRTGDEAQNVDQDASSFVDADALCPPSGIITSCSSQ